MKAITIRVSGSRAHFKRPNTNNNPCTFAVIHKPALFGIMGAVCGIQRAEMASLYPKLCSEVKSDGIKMAIRVLNPISKEAHGFTKRNVTPVIERQGDLKGLKHNFRGRRFCEVLRDPSYEITLGSQNPQFVEILSTFKNQILANRSIYPHYLGSINCRCKLEFISDAEVSEEKNGNFSTRHIVTKINHEISDTGDMDIFYENIPIAEDANRRYTATADVYCFWESSLNVKGPFYTISNQAGSDAAVCLI